MTQLPVTVLVVAKAPVPGLAKTRLAVTVGFEMAAVIASAALLDTLDAVLATPVQARVVALTGDLDDAHNSAVLRAKLAGFTVVDQHGDSFAERLAYAHADADAAVGDRPILQIGMDTPQAGSLAWRSEIHHPGNGLGAGSQLHSAGRAAPGRFGSFPFNGILATAG